MSRVALVGHSQLPAQLEDVTWELFVFRAPGGKVHSFFEDDRMCEVLNEKYDVVLLWLGSNDITTHTSAKDLADEIINIVYTLEEHCEAEVVMVLLEPRFCPSEYPVEHHKYRKIQNGVNKQLKKVLQGYTFLRFNSAFWEFNLASDGVHFNEEAKKLIKKKIEGVINQKLAGEASEEGSSSK